MFDKILIANRGEIACRIIKTARRLGAQTVAIYSTADAHALHVGHADEALWIGPAPSNQSYLDIPRIIAAATAVGAQAIHPGYGFLSENADFAQACQAAGIAFIGPSVHAIRVMGSKSEAKALMQRHGVPLVPGYYGAEQAPEHLFAAAQEVGLPLLIKATAGGGGRGMRIVRDYAEFSAALASAQREAQSAFGDPAVLLERYVENPRHIEVQIFGDTHGNVVHLFERDCSLQRRHQKVIEEAPAVLLSDAQRAQLFEAALKAARAVDYVGAGTVEFILNPAGEIFFIEMNTRLQVEHPVTERVTGLDLVEWQLRVAAGEPLPLPQAAIKCRGHALEVRVYAEDPAQDFRPSTGQLVHLKFPAETANIRVDTGVVTNDSVTPFYDAMIAKIITDGPQRADALQQMQRALDATQIVGVTGNIGYLQKILSHPGFVAGGFNTHFVEDERVNLLPQELPVPRDVWLLVALHALGQILAAARVHAARTVEPASPWSSLPGFRVNLPAKFEFQYRAGEALTVITLQQRGSCWTVTLDNLTESINHFEVEATEIKVVLPTRVLHGTIVTTAKNTQVFTGGGHYRVHAVDPLHTGEEAAEVAGKMVAPMPGAITAVLVKVGDQVARGTPLLILEAMKIEHTINAPFDGQVAEIRFQVGEQVLTEGVELIKLDATAVTTETPVGL